MNTERMNQKLDEIQSKLGELSARVEAEARHMAGNLKEDFAEAKKTIDKEMAEARSKIGEARGACREAWQAAKPGLRLAVQHLEQSYRQAAKRFKKPPAGAGRARAK